MAMKRFALATLLLVFACKAPEGPKGSADLNTHPDYQKFRPVAIALLPVEGMRSELRGALREDIYQQLFRKSYSPLDLRVIDQRMKTTGRFEPTDIDWDAKMEVKVSDWRSVPGGGKFAATGTAKLTHHKSGEVLWHLSFTEWTFDLTSKDTAQVDAMEELARMIVDRLPERPPLPRE